MTTLLYKGTSQMKENLADVQIRFMTELCQGKTGLKIFVVAKAKEGMAGTSPANYSLG